MSQTDPGLLRDFALWQRVRNRRVPLVFELEATARCPNNCRHCYINLPAGDRAAQQKELTPDEIGDLARQTASLGSVFCAVTGGDPLLRPDFEDVYLALKRAGLLISVFTSGTLVSARHAELFRRYPPRDIEVTVYGVTEKTYERVTRRPGSYANFRRGLECLQRYGIPVRLKAMALRSNVHEFEAISEFCRSRTKDFFRFDALLSLRVDGDETRNQEIRAERLPVTEIVHLERSDPDRWTALERNCGFFIDDGGASSQTLLHCGAGRGKFCITWDGRFQFCSSLRHTDFTYDLRTGNLRDAWTRFAPQILRAQAKGPDFRHQCGGCPIVNLCLWCPAHAYLETGSLEQRVPSFCEVAHARADALLVAVWEHRPDLDSNMH